jgi:dolichol-phosphate mannosyltransferase
VSYLPSHRNSGRSRWTLAKKVKLAIDSFTSFSYLPIRLVSALGMSIALLSFLYGLVVITNALVNQVTVQGWPTLMVTVLFLSGLQLLVSGMLGEYIWRTLDETRERPLYFVAESVGFDSPELASPMDESLYQRDAVRRRDYEIVR